MGLGKKLQTFICFNVNLEQQQERALRRKDSSNVIGKRTLCRAFLKSICGLHRKQRHLSATEHLYASILPSRENEVSMEEERQVSTSSNFSSRSSSSSSRNSLVELKGQEQQLERRNGAQTRAAEAAAEEEENDENAKRDALLVSLQDRLQDIIQRLLQNYGRDEEQETALLSRALSRRRTAPGGPNTWERRVQNAIDRLSRIHNAEI